MADSPSELNGNKLKKFNKNIIFNTMKYPLSGIQNPIRIDPIGADNDINSIFHHCSSAEYSKAGVNHLKVKQNLTFKENAITT
jgi:hypothetical protein